MKNSIINNEIDYKKYLNELEDLIAKDPDSETEDGERLLLLALAIKEYEDKKFFFNKPSAIEAIQFRMEEQGLQQCDLIPYIGSKSKVSEILAGKRKLTLPMIRTLHKYLEIPLELLIGEQKEEVFELTLEDINWSKFPLIEMVKRKWITSLINEDNLDPRETMADFLKPIGSLSPQSIMWRRTLHSRVEKDTDQYALLAWAARVMILAQKIKVDSYDKNLITIDFIKELAKLSQFSQGPLLAMEMLSKKGIKIIFQKQLPKTNIDGGCFLDTKGHPVIGMTLRYDRIDNFWYTLLHEIAHIYKHLANDKDLFIDNLKMESQKDQKEKEADKIAREAFIPRTAWERSDALIFRTKSAILEFSKKLGIHPAIVAGRIRYETKDYSQFSDLIGKGEIKNILKGYINE